MIYVTTMLIGSTRQGALTHILWHTPEPRIFLARILIKAARAVFVPLDACLVHSALIVNDGVTCSFGAILQAWYGFRLAEAQLVFKPRRGGAAVSIGAARARLWLSFGICEVLARSHFAVHCPSFGVMCLGALSLSLSAHHWAGFGS
jgi:hypothetical protein